MAVKASTRGPKGSHGTRGGRGRAGARGARGERGERGPAGPLPSREDVLALVEDQFAEMRNDLGDMRKQLHVQLTRFAQLQVQLDQIHKLLKQFVNEPN